MPPVTEPPKVPVIDPVRVAGLSLTLPVLATVRLRFPHAILVSISAVDQSPAVVGDVETGDMFPWELPDFCLRMRAQGIDPTGYVNLSNWAATRTEFDLRGIPYPHWWVADYDDIPILPPGCVAKQFANSTITGAHYDLSVVADYWPGVDQIKETTMLILLASDAQLVQMTSCLQHIGSVLPHRLVMVGE
jgi:hypothetical protein